MYKISRFPSDLVRTIPLFCRYNATNTFHKRELPASLIALSSPRGKEIFKSALASGHMESFFPLSEQFVTQSEPSFCALTSLAMVLNALNHDPKRTWKGVWRWITEETLQCDFPDVCGHSLDKVKRGGMNFAEFKSLARCHNVKIASFGVRHDSDKVASLSEFREQVIANSRSCKAESFLICNFSRKHLDQTGDGHFSPIGGYNPELDVVLIMDTARFKYPPFWVSLERLYESMTLVDNETGEPRGYFIVSTNGKENVAAACPRIDGGEECGVRSCGHLHHHSHHHSLDHQQ